MPSSIHSSTATQTDPQPNAWLTYHAQLDPAFGKMPPSSIVVDGLGTLRHAQAGGRMHRDYGEIVLSEPVQASTTTPASENLRLRTTMQNTLIECLQRTDSLQLRALKLDRTPLLAKMSSLLGVGVGLGLVTYGLAQQHTAIAVTGAVLLGAEATFLRRVQQEQRANLRVATATAGMRELVQAYEAHIETLTGATQPARPSVIR